MVILFESSEEKVRVPKEYSSPWNIEAVWGNQLAVVDGTGLKIMLFNLDGKLMSSFGTGFHKMVPLGSFRWPQKNKMIASNMMSDILNPRLYAIIDWSDPEGPKIRSRFGETHDQFETKKFAYGLTLANDFIWTASPYDNEGNINIFDLEGRLASQLRVSKNFRGITMGKKFEMSAHQVFGIHYLNTHLAVEVGGNRLYLYTPAGKAVAKIRFKGFSNVLATSEDCLVYQIGIPDQDSSPEDLEKIFERWGEDLKIMESHWI